MTSSVSFLPSLLNPWTMSVMAPAPHSCWMMQFNRALTKRKLTFVEVETVPPCKTRVDPPRDVYLSSDRGRRMKGCWGAGTDHARWGTLLRSLQCCHRWPPWFSQPRADLLHRNSIHAFLGESIELKLAVDGIVGLEDFAVGSLSDDNFKSNFASRVGQIIQMDVLTHSGVRHFRFPISLYRAETASKRREM